MVTLQDILTTVRELTFDRFIIPGIAFKALPGKSIVVTNTSITIQMTATPFTVSATYLFSAYPKFADLAAKLIQDGYIISYTPYFNGNELTTSLVPIALANGDLTANKTLYRSYFFSDAEIVKTIVYYYYQVLSITIDTSVDTTALDAAIQMIQYPSERHLCYWVAYYMVDRRRTYEAAATLIGDTYTDGTGYVAGAFNNAQKGVTVQIGSVFTIVVDPQNGYILDDFTGVGSDNVLGDKYSFWYKLMLYLRDKIEQEFGDYSLRKDTVFVGHSIIDKPLNIRSYFDSYPFTVSPLSRGILSENVAVTVPGNP